MPLSNSVTRESIHTRTLDIRVYRRDDGLWDVEGHLVDVKPFACDMLDGWRQADEPVHDMWLRLTVDETLTVVSAEGHMDQGAHGICHRIAPNYAALAGLTIGPGWTRAVKQRLGGVSGCTHLTELLPQMATTALQAMWSEREAKEAAQNLPPSLAEGVIDSCYTYRRDSDYVRDYFPAHYSAAGPGAAAED